MRILLSGGGTMGPVTPLLAVAEEFRGHDVLWVGTTHGPEREFVEAAGIRFQTIASGKLRRYFSLYNLFDKVLIIIGFFQSLAILCMWRPDVIVSAGGYVSVPVVWAGWVLRVPSVIHQQDVRPLLAIRLMAPFARKITVAFPETAERFHGLVHGTEGRMEVIGNPVRKFVEDVMEHRERLRAEGLSRFGFSADRPVILIFGGGTGSRVFNEFVAASLDSLLNVAQIIHVTGRGRRVVFKKNVGYVQHEFLTDDLPLAYAVADLVVSRAGMGAISELSAVGLPTILVPIPRSIQEANAEYLEKRSAAVVVREGAMFHRELLEATTRLLGLPARRSELSQAIHGLLPDSARTRLADIVMRVAKKEKQS